MFLQHVAHLRPQRIQIHLRDVPPVHQHSAPRRLQKSGNQIGEAGLASAGWANHGHQLADGELHGDVPQGLAAIGIAEVHLLERKALADGRQGRAADAIFVALQIQVEEHAPRCGHRFLQLDPERAEGGCGLHDAPEQAEQHEEIARRHLAGDDVVGNQHRHPKRGRRHHAEYRHQQQDHHGQVEALPQEGFAAAGGEPIRLLLHAAEALHRVDVVHGLFHGVGGGGTGGALALAHAAQQGGEGERDGETQRERGPGDPDEFRRHVAVGVVDEIEVDRRADDDEERHQRKLVADVRQRWRVVQHAVDGIADALIVQRRHR